MCEKQKVNTKQSCETLRHTNVAVVQFLLALGRARFQRWRRSNIAGVQMSMQKDMVVGSTD